ncbi:MULTISPECIES: glycosyltransferase [unclassified Neorhizobium]|uniref:glycosyltransferase n=1 Tax=unclassified Neorhizobium TaxID=2629175 RepID=UPI001FF376BB|nr:MULTISPECIES: glycosyltransferase [unclassified Neorhizobium]MCJ9669483.1 glycosyltransferase [Neorhizobium sp. SHOUNA12B]MCJ9744367.1 glycosyltransferase [Neorhizobium sp. SHOUNA12A]
MRIAYFTNQYPAPSHTFIRREIVALEARGHRVERYAIRPFRGTLKDPEDIGEARRTRHILRTPLIRAFASVVRQALGRPGPSLKALGIALRFARTSGGRYLRHLVYFWEAMILADWCRRDKIDHLHVHFGTNPATVATLAHEIGGMKFSFTVHGPEEFDRPETLGLGDKIRASSFVVAVSSYGRSQLLRWADLGDWRKIEVVHCGIDQRYLSDDVELNRSDPRLVCVARLSEQKGHLLLLQATANLRAEGTHFELVLVGDGPLRAEIGREIERLGLGGTVVLMGMISQDDVRNEILRAKALVLPSFAEGLPVVLMESMALKRPVISTYVAGIPELVQPDNGWLVPAGDLEALTGAMRQALFASDVELFRKGEAGRRRALERHDINKSAAALEILMARPGII